jgi:hypothetical protein
MNTYHCLLVAVAALSLVACQSRSDLTQSSLTLTTSTEDSVTFNVELGKNQSLFVQFGENGHTFSCASPEVRVGRLIVGKSEPGFAVSGDFFGYANPNATAVKILADIKEEKGRYRFATYSQAPATGHTPVTDIPVYVYLGKK